MAIALYVKMRDNTALVLFCVMNGFAADDDLWTRYIDRNIQ